ncbi:SRPBCC family protein [Frankia sp. Cas3]|uniref:type II toxin-antitoxin system Rv0910 family toxin n=1 Tax=Frankia sp. Cas3 TaxID=3073926 RepID=UPI002AD48C2E|nr:SRPBCC family protein [Frankia sp. Cas3]
MATVSASTLCIAPLDSVWATLTDLSRYPDWNTVHISFPKGAPAALEPSSTFTQKISNMGTSAEVRWTIMTVEPPRLLEFKGLGPMNTSVQTSYEVDTVEGGTRVTVTNEFTGTMVRIGGRRLTTSAQTALETSLAKFKDVVEY